MDFFAENNPEYTRDFSEEITPAGVLSYLDREKVARAVVLAEYAPQTTGVVTNEFLAEFCKGSDRLIPFGAICLYDGTDIGLQTERCIKELGCRGLKLLPTYAHHYPDDPRLMAAYEVAHDLGIPVMFHTGTSIFRGSRIRYGNPLLLDEVAEEFPRMTIIMSHGGRPFWFTEAEWMLRRHPNVHIDVAGIPPKRLPSAFPHLEKYQDRFVFGTDWPGIPSLSRQVTQIRQLRFDSGVIEAILWGNAERILGIEG
jgi:predicted TIM-barrel fold metal-dependent hydrolase